MTSAPHSPPSTLAEGHLAEVVSMSPAVLSADRVGPEFIKRIPRDFARQHLIIWQGNTQSPQRLAATPDTNPAAIFNVRVKLGGEPIEVFHAPRERIAQVIDQAYGRSNSSEEGVNAGSGDPGGAQSLDQLLAAADRDLLATAGKGPVIKLVDALLFEALSRRASDVHVQPLADRTLVRYRLDGVLHTVRELPNQLAAAIISRIKVMGKMDIAERRMPQDGRATVTIGPAPHAHPRKRAFDAISSTEESIRGHVGAVGVGGVDLRISTLPTSYGERAVIRLLDNTQHLCDFSNLGMPPEVARRFVGCAERSSGIILVTGPTGSGKTTTLYSTLGKIAHAGVNIMTIEDPIEYELSTVGLTVSQSQVNLKKGVNFATGLRHILRQDPDIVMVGEIRDQETARIAIQSSLTGHLVLSTLHTNDAPSAVTRLVDLGVESYLVSASLSAVLAQRLVRVVHEPCKGKGCEECLGTGFRGRIGIFELMIIDETLRGLIARHADLGEIRQAARAGGAMTLRDAGMRLVHQRRTTLAEVERVVPTGAEASESQMEIITS